MKRRGLALILIIAMITSLVSGCGDGRNQEILIEGLLNDENLTLSKDGIAMVVNPVNLESEANARITKVDESPTLDEEGDIQLEVYDFEIEGVEGFEGVMDIVIPLDVPEGEVPGAAYLNEETMEWEPVSFTYDDTSNSVVIATDHLSKYGVFSVKEEGKRKAYVRFLGLWGSGQEENYLAAINEFAQNGKPSTECIDIGASAAGDALQLGGDFFGGIVQSAGYAAYGEDVLSNLGDHLGSLGLLVSVVQVSSNLYNGKTHQAVAGSLKAAFTYMLNKAASKLSSSVMSASMASIAIVDYSINKFGTTAIEGRASIYRDAYGIYYRKGNDGYMSSVDWYKTFYPIFATPNMTEEQIKEKVDQIVTEHCNEFWGGSNQLGVDYYVSEAREKFNWTGGQAGLNDGIRNDISAEQRSILYQEVLPGVFQQIARKINLENERKLRAQYSDLADYLNTPVNFSVTDKTGKYAKHIVQFEGLNEKAIVDNWTGRLKNDGSLSTSFTLYGHMYAGAPTGLKIYEPDADITKDEPIRVVDFKVSPPAVEIVLSEELSALKYTGGEDSSSIKKCINAALQQVDTIKVDKEGNFIIEGINTSITTSEPNNTHFYDIQGFSMKGKIDPGSLKGTATANMNMQYLRKEVSPLDDLESEGETKEYLTTHSYMNVVEGDVMISGEGDRVTLQFNYSGVNTGYVKIQYHAIDASGNETFGDNPTVTDKSGDYTGSGAYTFTVVR